MKILAVITKYLFILCLPVLAFNLSIIWEVNNSQFYLHRFEKYNVQESLSETGLTLSDSQLNDIANGFVRYFNSSDELIHLTVVQNGKSVKLFNAEEILHFKDVKGLFRLNYFVTAGTFAYCLIFALICIFWQKGKYRVRLAESTIRSGILTLGIIFILGISLIFNFDNIFRELHFVAFRNDYWSVMGNMLLLFPEGFWYDTVISCAVTIVITIVTLGGISWIYLRRYRNDGLKNNLLRP
jgi:integral membrane protein (TIGR01906 family)